MSNAWADPIETASDKNKNTLFGQGLYSSTEFPVP